METITLPKNIIIHDKENTNADVPSFPARSHTIYGLRARLVNLRHALFLLKTAYRHYKSFKKSFRVLVKLRSFQKKVWGRRITKWAYTNKKYHFNLYTPGFSSPQLANMHLMEIKRSDNEAQNTLRFAFFAITKKCPLSCQHCFEWDKLNSKELLSYDDLRRTVIKLKEMGIVQLHLSGGEPMLRVKEIVKLAEEFSSNLEFYVLTSGFNATMENLLLLKQAGVTGIVVSVDHHDKILHNAFRGSDLSYDNAINAIKYARALDMIVTMSVCVTQSFALLNHLMAYARLARTLDASFIQLLEPKQVGNFAGKDVLLNAAQIQILKNFYETLNFNNQFKNFPHVIYHGYYQDKVGCFSAGNRSLYIDTNGDILMCPFCHHKSGNILTDQLPTVIPLMREAGCPTYGNSII